MEEDVEIDMLFKSTGAILMQATKEGISKKKSKEVEQPEKHTLSALEETRSSQNKENIYHLNETMEKPESSLQDNELNPQILTNQDVTGCNSNSNFKKQRNTLSSGREEFYHDGSCIERADDQLNQHLLDLIARCDPVKYNLSKQSSYISQFEEGENDYTTSEEDWDDDFGYKDDDSIDDILEEPQFKPQFLGNKNKQKVEAKSSPALTALGKICLKRDRYLLEVENILQQRYLRNRDRQKELQNILTEGGKLKSEETNSLRCTFRKFGMPYFCDYKGFHPPPNNDHQQKLDNEEIMLESIPKPNSWIKPHKEMLKSAIKKSLVEEKSTKLLIEIKKLKSMLEKAVKCNKSKNNKLIEQLTEKQEELKYLGKKTFKELVQSENVNREYDWMKFSVSLFDGLHSAEECKKFWNLYLKPSINKGAWSNAEDSKLSEIATRLKYEDWEKIAQLLGTNRSAFQCFVHYKVRIEGRSVFSSGKWTEVEDKKLLTVVNSSKVGNFIPWTKIYSHVGGRNHNQIYNRWANCLNPMIVKGRFSKEEDLLIVSGIEVFGVNFKQLASLMTNRTSSQLRERYERHLVPKTTKVGSWSLEEDEKLLNLVQKYGAHSWYKIANEMKTRTRTQVRQRYSFIQKMRRNNPGWTIAQVKRRDLSNVNKSVAKTNQHVLNIERELNEIKQVFHLSNIEKETFLIQKLAELRNQIMTKKHSKRGRRKKEIMDSQLDDTILDLFTSCFTKSGMKTSKFLPDDIHGTLNELFLYEKIFSHKLELPKSEEEVWNNPRLSSASKYFLVDVLKNSPGKCSLQNPFEQKIGSGFHISSEENNSLQRINQPIPEYDNTIIMKDWWHTPPVNVANLNFGEFFKRTVFDYSYGMHKDIWDSKIKRSQNSTGYDYSLNEEEELPPTQKYVFPPNQITAVGKRSILLSRDILERQTKEMDVVKHIFYDDFKKEVEEDSRDDGAWLKADPNTILNVCNHFQDNLLSLFAWPQILSCTKVAAVPVHKGLCSQKIQSRMQRNLIVNSGTLCSIASKGIIRSEDVQTVSLINSNNISQNNSDLLGKPNEKPQLAEDKDKHRRQIETEQLVKKRKLGNESLKANITRRKSPRSKFTKKSMKHTTLRENSNFNDNKLSKFEVSTTLESTSLNYSAAQNSTKRNSDNNSFEKQLKDSEDGSMDWQDSASDESCIE